MAALFSHKPWPTRVHGILSATRHHAMSLAKFATIYKVMLLLQKKLNGGIERDLDTFIAGGIGGWWVFGERTPVSSRVSGGVLCTALGVVCRRCESGPKGWCGSAPAALTGKPMSHLSATSRPWRLHSSSCAHGHVRRQPPMCRAARAAQARAGFVCLHAQRRRGATMLSIANDDPHLPKAAMLTCLFRSTSKSSCTSCPARSSP